MSTIGGSVLYSRLGKEMAKLSRKRKAPTRKAKNTKPKAAKTTVAKKISVPSPANITDEFFVYGGQYYLVPGIIAG
jgi:hypothetical protein